MAEDGGGGAPVGLGIAAGEDESGAGEAVELLVRIDLADGADAPKTLGVPDVAVKPPSTDAALYALAQSSAAPTKAAQS